MLSDNSRIVTSRERTRMNWTNNIVDGIEFVETGWKNHLALPGALHFWRKYPRDTLQIEDQKAELSRLATEKHWKQHPLSPPYSATQLSALETSHGFTFPEILRYYLGNISREIVISATNSSLVMSHFRPWKYCICGHYTIALGGPAKGYVSYRPFGYNDGGLMTMFEFLTMTLDVKMIRKGKIISALSDFKNCPDASQAIRDFRCSTSRASMILRSERDANKLLSVLEPGIKKLQKRFRLWKWRKDVYWNPHTDIGRTGLLVTTRAFLSLENRILQNR